MLLISLASPARGIRVFCISGGYSYRFRYLVNGPLALACFEIRSGVPYSPSRILAYQVAHPHVSSNPIIQVLSRGCENPFS